MLPWEHAAIAYVLYSGASRWRGGDPPAGWPVLVAVVASQLPDLIDKPLAWQFGLLPSGRTLAHSVFVAVPLALVVVALARRHGRPALGTAFAIGCLSHLATDAVPPYPGASTSVESVLWPLVTYQPESPLQGGTLERTLDPLLDASRSLVALEPDATALVGLGLIVGPIILWIYDGMPGLRGVLHRR